MHTRIQSPSNSDGWEVQTSESAAAISCGSDYLCFLPSSNSPAWKGRNEELEANAKLMASAPHLQSVCVEVLQVLLDEKGDRFEKLASKVLLAVQASGKCDL